MAERQEQQPAKREVTEIAENVLRMELPIRMPGLGHVNCYALLDRDGAAVVDPGLPGPATWKALDDRLRQAGLKMKDVHTVVVTHSHPDHFGGALRLSRKAGARVIAHESFSFGGSTASIEEPKGSVEFVDAPKPEAETQSGESPRKEIPPSKPDFSRRRTPWGGDQPRPPLRTRLKWRFLRMVNAGSFMPTITDPVRKGDVLKLGGTEWFIVHTPGHTEDHICLHSPESGLFLAGDHVLPTITPHISGIGHQNDPLASFYDSLDLVAGLPDVSRVLPAHGHPFDDLARRCEAIKEHHDGRLEKMRAISVAFGKPATVAAFSQKLFKPRSWGPMADSETFAHLEHLRIAGTVERSEDAEGRFLYLA
ncbi:MAG: MBL fold metallo-hydrolase [Myxococcota bacterium]|nr:MBL fold metallo-hydrolase [Myxococcota bacterium]